MPCGHRDEPSQTQTFFTCGPYPPPVDTAVVEVGWSVIASGESTGLSKPIRHIVKIVEIELVLLMGPRNTFFPHRFRFGRRHL